MGGGLLFLGGAVGKAFPSAAETLAPSPSATETSTSGEPRLAPEEHTFDEPAQQQLAHTTVPEAPVPPTVQVPEGASPAGGWPTAVLLHGQSSSGKRFLGFAAGFTQRGWATVVLTAPLPMGADRWGWPSDPAVVHLYVQNALSNLSNGSLHRDRPLLAGFSRGAGCALELATHYPERYGGVLAVAPSGRPTPVQADAPSVPSYVVVGDSDASARQVTAVTEEIWAAAGWPVRVSRHPGGHAPPSDWDERLGEAMAFLRTTLR